MNENIYITGHRNPDSDSIACTIAYSRLKEKLGTSVIPIRIGKINSETAYILRRFKVEAPMLHYDIRTRVCDIDFDEPLLVHPNDTVQVAWNAMRAANKNVVAVVDENEKLLGMCTASTLTNALLAPTIENYDLIKKIPLEFIAKTLRGELLVLPRNYHPDGKIRIASHTSLDIEKVSYQDDIVITSARESSHLYAIENGASLLIVTQSNEVKPEVIVAATKANCAVIVTPMDLYQTAQNLSSATPVKDIMFTKMITVDYLDYLDDVKATITQSRYHSYPIVDSKGRMKGFISRFHLWGHNKRKIILVDHNESSQSIEGIDQAEVVEIIDHHKVGDIQSELPIIFRNETCGACATIIGRIYEEKGVEMDPEIAGILCGAIVSDTMNFNSPTCTRRDREMAEKLAKIAGVDLDAFALDVIMASASLAGKGITEIVNNDLKEFIMQSYRIVIGQINIIDPESILEIKDQMREYLDGYCVTNHYDLALMIFTDISERGSYLLYGGSATHFVSLAFDGQMEKRNHLMYVADLMSRKQQVVPAISRAVSIYTNK